MNTKLVILATSWVVSLGAAYWIGSTFSEEAATVSKVSLGKSNSANFKSSPSDEEDTDREYTDEANPLAAFSVLEENPTSDAWELAEEALKTMRPWEAEEALGSLLDTPPSQRRDKMMLALLELWAQQSPEDALAYLSNIESLRVQNRASREILQTWGKQDAAAAMSWLNENSSGLPARTLNERILSIIEGYASADPAAAFTYSANLPSDTTHQRFLKNRALNESVQALVDQDRVGDALALAASLEDSATQEDVLANIIGEWAEYDPANAAQYLDSLGTEASQDARQELMRSWAQYDPEAAAAWLATLSADTQGTGRLVSELMRSWTQYDLDASAAWLNQIPPSSEIDRAVAIYTYSSAQEDPATAMTWAESITRDSMRERLMERVAVEWKQQDPESFQSYLDESSLTEEQKANLQKAQPWGGRRPRFGRD